MNMALRNELRKELEDILPDHHPFLDKFNKALSGNENRSFIVDAFGSFYGLVDAIDDWKRGIRDWTEVEGHLADSREALLEQES